MCQADSSEQECLHRASSLGEQTLLRTKEIIWQTEIHSVQKHMS